MTPRRMYSRICALLPVVLILVFTSACLSDPPDIPDDRVQFPTPGPMLPPVSVTIDNYQNGKLFYHTDCDATADTPITDLRRQGRILSATVFTAWQPLLDTSPSVAVFDRKPLTIPPTCTQPASLGTGVLAATALGSDLRLLVGIEWTERGVASNTPPGRTTVAFILMRDGTLHQATARPISRNAPKTFATSSTLARL